MYKCNITNVLDLILLLLYVRVTNYKIITNKEM